MTSYISRDDLCALYDTFEFTQAVRKVYESPDWMSVNVNVIGDGKCILYAIAYIIITDPCGHVLDQMENLFIIGIRLILQEEREFEIDTFTNDLNEYEFVTFYNTDDYHTLLMKFNTIINKSVISTRIVPVFARASGINIVVATIDLESKGDPLVITIHRVPPVFDDIDGYSIQRMPKYGFITTAFAHNFAMLYGDYHLAKSTYEHCELLEAMQQSY